MASIKDAQQIVQSLKERVEQLQEEVSSGEMDFSAVVKFADEIGEAADRVAMTFQKVNDAFEQQGEEGENGNGGGQSLTEALSPRSVSDGADSMSREELYERARKADIPGRSEMSKDQLVRALKRAGEKIG
jgi:methyl-accepting chemotaxis protein